MISGSRTTQVVNWAMAGGMVAEKKRVVEKIQLLKKRGIRKVEEKAQSQKI